MYIYPQKQISYRLFIHFLAGIPIKYFYLFYLTTLLDPQHYIKIGTRKIKQSSKLLISASVDE